MDIRIKGLTHVYMKGTQFEKRAVDGVTLSVAQGQYCALIGRTGSGKSTLVQHINGLLRPTSGTVSVGGMEVAKRNLRAVRAAIGMAFQYPEHQLFEETVHADIAFGLKKSGADPAEVDGRVSEAAKAVGLHETLLGKSPFEISGGERRRAAIAGILVTDPSVLIMDEPAAGLDPKGRDELFEIIGRFHRDKGATVILVSHSMDDVAAHAERVIAMDAGKVVMDGPPSEVFADAGAIEAIGLLPPETAAFMARLRALMPELGAALTVGDAAAEVARALRARSVIASSQGSSQ